MADITSLCPPYVKATLAAHVAVDLDKILRLQYLTKHFAEPLENLATKITDDLDNIAAAVPVPVTFNFSDPAFVNILMYLCPLTPLALIEDPSLLNSLDPNQMNIKFSRIVQFQVKQVVSDYEAHIDTLSSADVVRLFRRYIKDLYRIMENPTDFLTSFSLSVGYTLVIKTMSSETYNSTSYPFKAFDEARKDWHFDGVLPTGLGTQGDAVARKLASAELRIMDWQALTIQAM